MIDVEIINMSVRRGLFSIRDLVFMLGVKKSDIKYWVDTGRFGKSKNSYENINAEFFLKFFNEYITTYELSLHLDITSKNY
jgi:hypothetical protein